MPLTQTKHLHQKSAEQVEWEAFRTGIKHNIADADSLLIILTHGPKNQHPHKDNQIGDEGGNFGAKVFENELKG